MARKPRSDSVLDGLPPERREQLVRWLVDENLKYPEAVARVWEKFGVKTSVNALQRFYARRCFAMRADQAREFAELVVEQAAQDPEKFDEATVVLIRQRAFERMYARDGSLTDLAVVAKILDDRAKLEMQREDGRRKQADLERKLKDSESRRAVAYTSIEIANQKIAEMERKQTEWEEKRRAVQAQLERTRTAPAANADEIRAAAVAEIDRIMGLAK